MSGLLQRRSVLLAGSLTTYALLVYVGLLRMEVPGLGISHFLYVPIVLLALATGPAWGAFAGCVAAVLCVTGAALNPHFAPDERIFSISSGIRLLTFVGIGWLVGWSARRNRELLQRLREHAERDFLTELLNARAFEAELGRRLGRGAPFALLLLDVDDLKGVNDSEGHAEGNAYLRRLAAVLRRRTAPGDVVARIGGDEFVVLTDVGTREAAEDACRQLRLALAASGIRVSFGFAMHPGEGHDSLSLFHAADKRLYEGKMSASERHLRSVS